MLTVTLNPAVDISAQVGVIEPDRKLHCTEVGFEAGGGGVNVARAAHALGAAVSALVVVGGGSGDRLVTLLEAEGVGADPVAIAGLTRECLAVREAATGREYRFVLPGPIIDRSELAVVGDRVGTAAESEAMVIVSGSLPGGVTPDDLAVLLRVVGRSGGRLIVDTSGPALIAAASVGTTVMKPSRRELAAIAGFDLDDERAIVRAGRQLLDRGPNHDLIVSLGAAGALLVGVGGRVSRVHAPSVHALSTVGAGDSMVAAIAVALERGSDIVDATRWGVAAGTAATLSPGTGLCRRADVERLLGGVTVTTAAARSPTTPFR